MTHGQFKLAREARLRHDDTDDTTVHIWEGKAKFAYLPMCKFCGTTSTEAQKNQPETKGVGPCLRRLELAPLFGQKVTA